MLLGEFAALGSALLFTGSSVLFTIAGRGTDAATVNRVRLAIALLLMTAAHSAWMGSPLPLEQSLNVWALMGLSGFIGLYLGDTFLFQAFVLIGPRLSMLIFALAPIFAAVMGWIFLDERLQWHHWAGIAITVFGVGLVAAEPVGLSHASESRLAEEPHGQRDPSDEATHARGEHLRGLLFALGGSVGQAVGLVVAKLGLSTGCPAVSGNVIRLVAAAFTIWSITILRGRLGPTLRTVRGHPRALRQTALGALFGPAIGVWLSLVAIQRAPVGVASALMSLTPIFLIPLGRLFFHEVITPRAVIGTLVAVGGSALLFV